jgi:prophage regulatory protein
MTIPRVGFARIKQVLGDPKAIPPIQPIVPVSRSTWWAGVKNGRYPAPVKLGPRTTAWRWSDIAALVDQLSSK